MKLNEKYKIESDLLNVVISQKVVTKDKEGEEKITWKNIAFCPDINNALKWLCKREILGTGLKDLEEVNEKIKELYNHIDELIPSGE